MKKILTTLALSLLCSGLYGGPLDVWAFSSLMRDFNARYETSGTRLDTCGLCHRNFSTGSVNQFGKDYDRNGGPAIENEDPDNDGFSTITEIRALTMPGYACNALPTGSRVPADLRTYCEPSGGNNGAPTANAGPDQTVSLGATVLLTAAGSTDPDGNPLRFSWELIAKPDFSAASLSPNGQVVNPTFLADVAGSYTFQLNVNDGMVDSALPDFVTISTLNSAPTAHAGPDQAGTVGVLVRLNGSGSSDPDGNPLTYVWRITSQPGSVLLSNPTSAMPTFTPNVPGRYECELVVSDGQVTGEPDRVIIVVGGGDNMPPVANAGEDFMAIVGNEYGLNGLQSRDGDNDPLTYRWALTTRPEGSNASISGVSSPTPTVRIDAQGSYTVQLIVNDGVVDSIPDTLTITTERSGSNLPPVADAGQDQTVQPNRMVTLDGTQSRDPNEDALTFKWTFTSKPSGSDTSLDNSTSSRPSFVPDVAGRYIVQCIVNDTKVDSVPDTVTILVQDAEQHETLEIDKARYKARKRVLYVKGHGIQPGERVTVSDATTGREIATVRANRRGIWKVRAKIRKRSSVPCMIQGLADGQIDTMVVKNAPLCGSGRIQGNIPDDENDNNNRTRRFRQGRHDRHDD